MKPHDLARSASRAAGFDVHEHDYGFTGILNRGPASPVLLFVLDRDVHYEIRGGLDLCRPLAQGRGFGHMCDALRAISAFSIVEPRYPVVVRVEPACPAARALQAALADNLPEPVA